MTHPFLLTIPDTLDQIEPYLPTGNEFVSLPTLSPRDASVAGMNVLSMRARGLLEFRGEPLIAPIVEINDVRIALRDQMQATRLDDWLPQFRWTQNDTRLTLTIFAPPGQRGWVYTFDVENGDRAQTLRLGLAVNWRETTLTIFSTRTVNDTRHAAWDRWTRAFVCESVSAEGTAAFAIGADAEIENQTQRNDTHELTREFTLAPHQHATLAFFIAVGAERDGARTTAMDLRRHGADALLAETRQWLQARRSVKPNRKQVNAALDTQNDFQPPWANAAPLPNLFFAYFFSLGTTIDTEELALVTSRSPLYYVSAAMWPRDTLLWSLPGILALDPAKAREVLLVAFTRHLKHPGEHAQYIDGTLLYPGFELDQLCAFPIALHRYWRATHDDSILREPAIRHGIEKILAVLMTRKHPQIDLFSTFLLSTDDPTPMPYVTYSNALASVALKMIGEMKLANRQKMMMLSHRVRAAIYEHCVVPTARGKIFAGAVDLQGNHRLFDEPPGSLVILPHYGFCKTNDPVYRRTVAWIHSTANPYYREHRGVPMPACVHAPFAWAMSAVNQILASPRSKKSKQIATVLAQMPLDSGLACESVEPATGIVKTGRMMASFAGWLGYALIQAL
jgi:hypothetical protein